TTSTTIAARWAPPRGCGWPRPGSIRPAEPMNTVDCFAQSYAEARQKFLAAAELADLDVESHAHPMLGRDGEVLALDVVRDGPKDEKALLLISRGYRGDDGYCGSGLQIEIIRRVCLP